MTETRRLVYASPTMTGTVGGASAIGEPRGSAPSDPGRAQRTPSTVSVLLPVYNSSQTLEPLMNRLHEGLPTCMSAYEVVLVKDGSRDASWEVVSALARKYPKCRDFSLIWNYGQHRGDCPVTEDICTRLIRLPFFTGLAAEEQSGVIAVITDS